VPAHAKKPRTKTEEASGSSYCRAKEAVGYLQHHAASVPAIDAATPGAAASNGTASRAACIKDKTDREAYDVIVALAANDMLKGVPRPGRHATRRFLDRALVAGCFAIELLRQDNSAQTARFQTYDCACARTVKARRDVADTFEPTSRPCEPSKSALAAGSRTRRQTAEPQRPR
jgi:hypothetical protein